MFSFKRILFLAAWGGAWAVCAVVAYRGYLIAKYQEDRSSQSTLQIKREAALRDLNEAIPASKYSLGAALQMDEAVFREGITTSLMSIYSVTADMQRPVKTVGEEDGWAIYDMQGAGLLPTRLMTYKDDSTTGMPVLVIDDEAGAKVVAGLENGRPGRAAGAILAGAGHPVLVMELQGFGSTDLPQQYGYHGSYMYNALMKSLGRPLRAAWLQDALAAFSFMKTLYPGNTYGVVGISKSAALAVDVALLQPQVSKVYAASGFSVSERTNFSYSPNAYVPGERMFFEYLSLLAACTGSKVRLSYGLAENDEYGKEARDKNVLSEIRKVRTAWGIEATRISQHSHPGAHSYDYEDLKQFFQGGE